MLMTIKEAEFNKQAIGHFNFSNLEGLWGIAQAGLELNLPIILSVSEGERDFVGIRQARVLVDSLREEFDHPFFLNADHTYSLDRIKEVVEAGYDGVVIDGSQFEFEQNLDFTTEAVAYIKANRPDMVAEGEIGYIGSSSKVLEKIPDDIDLTNHLVSPDLARRFVETTKVDLLAPAVGNLHGMLKNLANPKLDIEKITAIKQTVSTPLVLHGGSGISDADFKASIKAGISVIHVNTELRLAYRDALKLALQTDPTEIAPYRLLKPAMLAMKKVATDRLRLFASL